MQAIYHGKKFVAKYLINAGANVLIPAKNKCTAFDMASIIGMVNAISRFIIFLFYNIICIYQCLYNYKD